MSQVNLLLTSIVKCPLNLNKNQFFKILQFIKCQILILKKYLKNLLVIEVKSYFYSKINKMTQMSQFIMG